MTKIPVTKTMDGNYWLMFDEADVRRACILANCKQELIEECVDAMRGGDCDCTTCYVGLCNEIKVGPVYKTVARRIES